MKKVVFIAICMASLLSFTSCGSTSPCGLAESNKQIKQNPHQQEVLVADVNVD